MATSTEYFWFKTRAGTFRIVRDGDRWQPWFEDERLMGRYRTPQVVAEELANGVTDWPSCGNPATLGLPEDIAEWEHVKPSR